MKKIPITMVSRTADITQNCLRKEMEELSLNECLMLKLNFGKYVSALQFIEGDDNE